MAVIFNFGVAGVLAGLNWKRLGKPERMWPTILVSLAGMFAFEAMILSWPVDDSLFYAICAALGALFAFWQGSYYSRWVATYGKAKTGVRGFLTMLGIGLGIQLVDYLAHVVMSFLQAIFTTGF